MLVQSTYLSPVGKITLLASKDGLKGVWFNHQKYYGHPFDLVTIPSGDNEIINKTKRWLDDYFSGKNPKVDKAILAPETTNFRKEVFDVLIDIPYGKTMSYQEIATILEKKTKGRKTSARAVGGAVGHNPISLLIPCHRVIGSDGSLTGYAGGLDKKTKFLMIEGIINDNS